MCNIWILTQNLATRSRSALPLGLSKNLFACQSKKGTQEMRIASDSLSVESD